MRNCGHYHDCGTPLNTVLDGEQWCPQCEAYRRYWSHGWGASGEGPGCPNSQHWQNSTDPNSLMFDRPILLDWITE